MNYQDKLLISQLTRYRQINIDATLNKPNVPVELFVGRFSYCKKLVYAAVSVFSGFGARLHYCHPNR